MTSGTLLAVWHYTTAGRSLLLETQMTPGVTRWMAKRDVEEEGKMGTRRVVFEQRLPAGPYVDWDGRDIFEYVREFRGVALALEEMARRQRVLAS